MRKGEDGVSPTQFPLKVPLDLLDDGVAGRKCGRDHQLWQSDLKLCTFMGMMQL